VISYRIGQGYDVHRLVAGRKLILGGVEISSELGLDGHSDADVAIHALIDSLLGAAAMGDIGSHFPDTDPVYKNADSMVLLQNVVNKIEDKKYSIANVDITVIAEKPKILPFVDKMRENIANVLKIPIDNVSLKGTTNERIGFIGRGEGIAALSVALLYK
jgi:2-C-methyl-D-erythritol 2,4-cyclodiphosphate synthase